MRDRSECPPLIATAAVVLTSLALVACSTGSSEEESNGPTQPPPQTPTATASPTATAPATSGPVASPPPSDPEPTSSIPFETQNGSIRVEVPAGWEVDDRSAVEHEYTHLPSWANEVIFRSPEGVEVIYDDTWAEIDPGAAGSPHVGIVDWRDIGGGLAAMAWWELRDEEYFPQVGVSWSSGSPQMLFIAEGVPRIHAFSVAFPEPESGLPDAASAEAFLREGWVDETLDLLQSLEFVGHPSAVPPGVTMEWYGQPMVPYTTANDSASFLMPVDWTVDDRSYEYTEEGGEQAWHNAVWVVSGDGYPALIYSESPDLVEVTEYSDWEIHDQEFTLTSGDAMLWTYELETSGVEYRVGVGISEVTGANGAPTGRFCTGDVCRQFIGGSSEGQPTAAGLDEEIESELWQTAFAVVASLDVHHDDVTRLP